jgi:hypothetical protein
MARVLLVGLKYNGPLIEGVQIDTRGLCSPDICQTKAADPLYEYNIIIIYPKSYSHFIFGEETEYSDSMEELWDLKKADNNYDLDTVINFEDRKAEMNAAIKQGTLVIWLITPDKPISFFGKRNLYLGYLNSIASNIIKGRPLYEKSSKKIFTSRSGPFDLYFDHIKEEGWSIALGSSSNCDPIATTPEGYFLGCEIKLDNRKAWIITPPKTDQGIISLIKSAMCLEDVQGYKIYNGIFLCHSYEDKPFVRILKCELVLKGVENVWVDEAEIMIGDSLISKIQEGIDKTEYFGIIISPRSIESPWVRQELEQAMNIEIQTKTVKVLPLLYEKCELPGFLRGKLYADFTSEVKFENELNKVLKRLEI